jgi:hypothetical protein
MTETPVGYWPDVELQWSPRRGKIFKTEILEMSNGVEQRRALYDSNGFQYYEATTQPLDQANRKIITEFLESKQGKLISFYFFRKEPTQFEDYECGTVDTAWTIEIPFKESTVTTVYVNGVSKNFTVTPNSGQGGEDLVTFTDNTQTGTVTVDLVGRERIIVRNDSDSVDETFMQSAGIYSTYSIRFKQVR